MSNRCYKCKVRYSAKIFCVPCLDTLKEEDYCNTIVGVISTYLSVTSSAYSRGVILITYNSDKPFTLYGNQFDRLRDVGCTLSYILQDTDTNEVRIHLEYDKYRFK